jgi:hypothetical protein
MNTILFIDIAYYRPTIAAVSEQLAARDVRCLYGWLGDDLPGDLDGALAGLNVVAEQPGDRERGQRVIQELESAYPDFRLALCVRRDRFLPSRLSRKWRQRFQVYAAAFDRALESEQVDLVVGEVSTAIEYLFYFVALRRGVVYRHLLNLPTISPRVILFDHTHSAKCIEESNRISAEVDTLNEIGYWQLLERVKQHRPTMSAYIDSIGDLLRPSDYRKNLKYKLRYLVKPFFAIFYRLVELTFGRSLKGLGDSKFAYLALHIQPESTPDFVSVFYADQFELARQILAALPSDYLLVIKEHPNQLSIRKWYSMFPEFLHGRLVLLNRFESADSLLKKASLVITIAGSVCIEAAQSRRPVLVFSDVFFKALPNVVDAREHVDLASAVNAATALDIDADFDAESWMQQLGAPGFYHDPRLAPEVLGAENIRRLSRYLYQFLEVVINERRPIIE